MIFRKSDFSENAIEIGLWESLCDLAGVPEDKDGEDARADVELEITQPPRFHITL
jgi:hypothetical protein